MLRQRTLKTTIRSTGVGLHTGARVELTLRPAQPDTGVVFHRDIKFFQKSAGHGRKPKLTALFSATSMSH